MDCAQIRRTCSFDESVRFIDGLQLANYMQKKQKSKFLQWALIGKDEGMERGHAASVQAMLELAIPKLNGGFSAIDLGVQWLGNPNVN